MGDDGNHRQPPPTVNTRIMVAAVVVLFVVVLFILFLHVYARWFWRNARIRASGAAGSGSGSRAWSRRFRRRRMRFSFRASDPSAIVATAAVVPGKGLDKSVLESLPVFYYTKKALVNDVNAVDQESTDEDDGLDCAVCLSEFEENEAGRRLPRCGHVFHTDCIDMWFATHSTCPLCRSSVGDDQDEESGGGGGGGERDLESGGAEESIAVVRNNHGSFHGEQLLRDAVVLLAAGNSNPSSSPAVSSGAAATVEAIRILQNEGAALLQDQHGGGGGGGSSSSSGLKSPQQQLFPASVLFWGNRSYTNSSTSIGSSSSQHQEQQQYESSTGSSAAPLKQRSRELIIEVPRRPAASFSSQLPSPNSAEGVGSGSRSPLGAHLRSIKRLLSRDSRRCSFDYTSPSPVGRDCCEAFQSASQTPGSITPTSQC